MTSLSKMSSQGKMVCLAGSLRVQIFCCDMVANLKRGNLQTNMKLYVWEILKLMDTLVQKVWPNFNLPIWLMASTSQIGQTSIENSSKCFVIFYHFINDFHIVGLCQVATLLKQRRLFWQYATFKTQHVVEVNWLWVTSSSLDTCLLRVTRVDSVIGIP